MELNQLKTFVTVAEEKHLTRAAERLFTSQPAVSAQLKALEESLGVVLFDRTPKGMALTPAGETLLGQAQAALDAANLVVSHAKSIKGEVMGQLSVGVNSDFSFLRLGSLLAGTSEHYPGLSLSFVNGMSPDILLDIRKGNLDTGFFFGSHSTSDVHTELLMEVPTAVVAPVEWADKINSSSLSVLASLPWIYTTDRCPFYHLQMALFSGCNLDPPKAVFVDNEDAIRELIKSGAGVALLRLDDAERAESEGWGVRWEGESPSINLSIAVLARRMSEPVIQAWLSELAVCWPTGEQAQCEQQVG